MLTGCAVRSGTVRVTDSSPTSGFHVIVGFYDSTGVRKAWIAREGSQLHYEGPTGGCYFGAGQDWSGPVEVSWSLSVTSGTAHVMTAGPVGAGPVGGGCAGSSPVADMLGWQLQLGWYSEYSDYGLAGKIEVRELSGAGVEPDATESTPEPDRA